MTAREDGLSGSRKQIRLARLLPTRRWSPPRLGRELSPGLALRGPAPSALPEAVELRGDSELRQTAHACRSLRTRGLTRGVPVGVLGVVPRGRGDEGGLLALRPQRPLSASSSSSSGPGPPSVLAAEHAPGHGTAPAARLSSPRGRPHRLPPRPRCRCAEAVTSGVPESPPTSPDPSVSRLCSSYFPTALQPATLSSARWGVGLHHP